MTPNAKLSRRVAVGSNAGLGRGGAVYDGYEKNPALDASAVFKTQNRIMVPEPFTVEQRYERALHDVAEKTPATRGTARKELTLLARAMNLKPPLRLVLGRIMSPESCQHTRPNQALKRVLTFELRGTPTMKLEQRP